MCFGEEVDRWPESWKPIERASERAKGSHVAVVWVPEPAVYAIGCGTAIPSASGASIPVQHLACHLLPVYCFTLTRWITHVLFVGPWPLSHDLQPGFVMILVCLWCSDRAATAADRIVVLSLEDLFKIRKNLSPLASVFLSWFLAVTV